jgi:sulfite reductase alpha subunit-like flavoprotein
VCGGAFGFGPAVSQAFVEHVFGVAGGMSPEEGKQLLKDLLDTDRYLEDLSD